MKQLKHILLLASIAFVLAATLPAVLPTALPANGPTSTPRLNFDSGVCGEFADTLEPHRTWIPVGCEALTCCPGCPDVGIDWRIRVSDEPLESVLLQFDNLSPAAARKLRIKGKARWEGSALRVWAGETVLSGFKHDPRATPAVATPRLFGNRESLRRLQQRADSEAATGTQAARPSGDRSLARMEVSIEQLMGKYSVSEARVAYNVKSCQPQPGAGDRILLNNNALNDNVIALIDARDRNGCVRDQFYRGVVSVNVGDLQPFDICFSETSIFSDDNGMYYVKPDIWTDSPNDEHPVTLPHMFRAPVAVWIAIDGTAQDRAAAQQRAERDMANANYLYNTHKVGVWFDATYADAADLAEIANRGCNNAARVRVSNFYRPGQLNVYYINSSILSSIGWNCSEDHDLGTPDYDPNIIFVNSSGLPETLAHEFGHAFSLYHPDMFGITGIGSNNLMWSGGSAVSPRTDFTIGQAFRMNLNSTSMMNANGLRLGWGVRDPPCRDEETSELCPHLSTDTSPK